MDIFSTLNHWLDPFLIWPFRIPGNAYLGFALGLVWVSLLATIIGELSMAGAYFFNKKDFRRTSQEMIRHNNLSYRALQAQDKAAFKALNAEANEQFGKSFFSRIALFGASMWPAFFAMGWIDHRFGKVDDLSAPFIGQVTPAFYFVLTYIVIRVLFSKTKKHLPLFRTIEKKVLENEDTGEKLMGPVDLMEEDMAKARAAEMAAKGQSDASEDKTSGASPQAAGS